jgi:hypothetical protein
LLSVEEETKQEVEKSTLVKAVIAYSAVLCGTVMKYAYRSVASPLTFSH